MLIFVNFPLKMYTWYLKKVRYTVKFLIKLYYNVKMFVRLDLFLHTPLILFSFPFPSIPYLWLEM